MNAVSYSSDQENLIFHVLEYDFFLNKKSQIYFLKFNYIKLMDIPCPFKYIFTYP